jgi:hypothetical protein
MVFFSALAGIGYVDPEAQVTTLDPALALSRQEGEVPEFVMGGPVFDLGDEMRKREREKAMEVQRELEKEWSRKRRPKDVSYGFWVCGYGLRGMLGLVSL